MTRPRDIPVLLLPGLDGTARMFGPLIAAAPPGLSPRPVAYPEMLAEYEELLPVVREAMPRRGAWICVGESFSGPLAVLLAGERPAGLAALVLVATTVHFRSPRWPCGVPAALFRPLPGRRVLARRLLFDRTAPPELVSTWEEAVGAVPAKVLAARLRAFLAADLRRELTALPVPVLHLEAQRDRLLDDCRRAAVRDALPAAEWRSLDAPHFLLQTRPREAWEAIAGLVDRVVANRRPGAGA